MTDLATQFQQPGAAWRGKPFWSWNGDLDEGELIRQIHVMRDMGLGGFFMHSRTGLSTEYLGDEWFRLTNACADAAEKLGMEAWLYDEDRWPSGTAGGLVTENPAYRLRYLSLRPIPGSRFEWDDQILAAFLCRLDGLAYSDCCRIDAQTPPAAYRDKTVLAFTLEEMAPSSFYNGYTYVDTLNQEATRHYIRLTHEQYKSRCGDRLGRTIRGIFTDEPHRGAVMSGFSLSNENRLWMTPWTEQLPARFQQQFGHDLVARLPELFLLPNGQAVSPVKWQYMEVLQQMFLDNFVRPLYEWCDQNGMRLTGHALHEDSLTAQAAMQGSLMRFYEYLHDPGVDVLSEGNRNPAIVKQLSSAARQLGRTWLLSELYGCTGWQMNFRSHKEVGDWQALLGINLRCHHLSWYTMAGEAKRDYPASILHQSAWWPDYKYVETYFARLGLLLSQGAPCCEILVLNPIESVWCQIHAGWADGLTPTTKAVQELENAFVEITAWLLGAHLDFDYGDEEILGHLAQVERSQNVKPRLRVGKASYSTAIVGRMTTMRASTLRLLSDFLDAGGQVLFAGEPPAYLDACPSPAPAKLAARAACLPWDKDALIGACRTYTESGVVIQEAETGEDLPQIICQERQDGEGRIIVALNRSDTQGFQTRLHVRFAGRVEEWDCRSGERYAVASRRDGDWIEWSAEFSPSGERAFVLTETAIEALAMRPAYEIDARLSCGGPFEYSLSEENVCVLDFARYQIDDEPWQERLEVLKVDQSVRRTLGLTERGGEMVQPWHRRNFQPAPPVLARVRLAFDFAIDTLPSGQVWLCLEQANQWRITLNGQAVSGDVQGWWIDRAFQKVSVPASFMRLGPNELVMEADFREDLDIEAVYLIGHFGVALNGPRATLTTLKERLHVGDLTEQGLPFYGGTVRYYLPIPSDIEPQVFVTAASFEAACLKVCADGQQTQIISWPPYQAQIGVPSPTPRHIELEAVLTRRNTFGPLHQIPLRAGAYGPANFTTEGAAFSEDYMLYPSGLLAAPELSWAKPL